MGVSYNPKIVTNGLILYLDAGNPKSYPGSGSSWSDLSGNANNGTLYNTPTYSTTNGGILTFNGSTQYADDPVLTDAFLQGTWTACFWVRFTVLSGYTVLLQHGSTAADKGLYLGATTVWYHSYYSDDMTSSTVTTNTWYNAVFTANNTTKARAIYINGKVDKSGTATGSYTGTGSNAAFFKNVLGYGTYFTGNASNIMVYNRVLTDVEIKKNFNALRGRFGI